MNAPLVRVEAGRPDDAELAAVTAVLVGLLTAPTGPAEAAAAPPPSWTRPAAHRSPEAWTCGDSRFSR